MRPPQPVAQQHVKRPRVEALEQLAAHQPDEAAAQRVQRVAVDVLDLRLAQAHAQAAAHPRAAAPREAAERVGPAGPQRVRVALHQLHVGVARGARRAQPLHRLEHPQEVRVRPGEVVHRVHCVHVDIERDARRQEADGAEATCGRRRAGVQRGVQRGRRAHVARARKALRVEEGEVGRRRSTAALAWRRALQRPRAHVAQRVRQIVAPHRHQHAHHRRRRAAQRLAVGELQRRRVGELQRRRVGEQRRQRRRRRRAWKRRPRPATLGGVVVGQVVVEEDQPARREERDEREPAREAARHARRRRFHKARRKVLRSACARHSVGGDQWFPMVLQCHQSARAPRCRRCISWRCHRACCRHAVPGERGWADDVDPCPPGIAAGSVIQVPVAQPGAIFNL